jgi:hypothetical protein
MEPAGAPLILLVDGTGTGELKCTWGGFVDKMLRDYFTQCVKHIKLAMKSPVDSNTCAALTVRSALQY